MAKTKSGILLIIYLFLYWNIISIHNRELYTLTIVLCLILLLASYRSRDKKLSLTLPPWTFMIQIILNVLVINIFMIYFPSILFENIFNVIGYILVNCFFTFLISRRVKKTISNAN